MSFRQILTCIAFFYFSLPATAQWKQYQFARIDVNDGLSHNMVNDIIKDSNGFMWFATASGLNRYNGYSIKVYQNIPGDTSSILVNDATRLFEGPDGKIWIYSHAGNNVYNHKTESFHRNTDALLRRLSIAEGLITYINKDRKGNYWFIHYNQGLFRYNPQEKKTTRFQHDPRDPGSIATMSISAVEDGPDGSIWIIHQNGIFERLDGETQKITYRNEQLKDRFESELFEFNLSVDSDGDLWIFSNSNLGCFYFDTSEGSLESMNENTSIRLNSNIVRKIIEGDHGMIWVATDHGGLNLIDKKQGFKVHYILHDEEDEKSLSQNSINSAYKDDDGIIWIGTYKSGISYYHENIFRFQLIRHFRSKPNSLPFNDINAFAEDEKGNLWIGTNGGGIIYYDRKNNKFTQYRNDPADRNSLSNNVVVSLFIDHKKILWIGTYYGGLNSFDGKRFKHYRHDPADPESLGDDNVWEILEDSNHNLWIGTLRGGVDVFNREKDAFYHYRSGGVNSIHTNYVASLMEDSEGNMFVGTGYGLEILEKQSGRFVHYLNDVNNPETISHNNVLSILEDSRGLVWIGTHNGLNLFDKVRKTFRVFREKDGMPHNMVLTMAEDNEKNIWMSTPNGLSKLSATPAGNGSFDFAFKNYDESDGLQVKAFNENAVLKCSSGELVFGGSQGFNIFRPEEIGVNLVKPRVILSDFQIFNKSVQIGEMINKKVVLKESIHHTDTVVLHHSDNVFSIEFAALSLFHPEKSQYQYILEAFNKDWVLTDASQRKVTYTNLDPGNYVFKVKASNNDGLWNETPAALVLTVLPPFWKTKTAFVLYAVTILAALLLARWLILANERMNFKIHQERHEAQRMHELDMMKIRFFTNVSHEFRTPLTLILTPLEKMLKQTNDGEQQKHFQLIHRNARRLLNLVNQLLDFRKMEVQEFRFNPSEGDIIKFVHEVFYSFSDLSEKKNIRFTFQSSVPELETLFDQDKLEKILFNLLSNAFKFTPDNGSVAMELNIRNQDDRKWLEIIVKDSGIGIPPDKQEKIFERFFQNDLPKSMMNQGSGIGLSITKEFVKIHGGSIHLQSEPEKGSSFTVLLPLTEIPHHAVEEIIEEEFQAEHLNNDGRKPILLLVEDNEDFRFYLKDNLKQHYSIMEAKNGKEGLQRALASLPDLIVSDIMMPEMNGIELCKKIRTDPRSSHIPVILLTARTAEEQKMEGFESGANDYVTKPFNFEILQSRIKNLISQREAFQKVFHKHLDIRAADVHITSLDEKLIKNAIGVVEANIAKPEFSVEEFSRELGMSRVHLYKKLLALTGKSPLEFIRTIRLQRAAQLLEKSQLSVSEIAYKVGFNNPKYFSKYFKDHYHVLPSTYASERKLANSKQISLLSQINL